MAHSLVMLFSALCFKALIGVAIYVAILLLIRLYSRLVA